jgi:iron complex transport system ATP-binding protein
MIFEVKKGYFGYGKSDNILSDISLQVESGEILSILGPNGIGKTSLLKCMMGFLKWRSGESILDGEDILHIEEKRLWKNIAYVPQAKSATFSFSVLEMVLMGRSAHLGTFTQPSVKDEQIALQALEEVGIIRLRDRLFGQLSGGEMQLVLIAKALAVDPQIIVMDEPESGLDFKNQLIILSLIHRLVKKKEISAIINTHYPMHALKIADKTLILHGKQGYFYGNTREIINEENMRTAFGVNVFIGSIEVNGRRYDNMVPLSLA